MTTEAAPPLIPDPSDLTPPLPNFSDPPLVPPSTPYHRGTRSPLFIAGLTILVVLTSAGIGFATGHISRTASQDQRFVTLPTSPLTTPSDPNFSYPGFTTPNTPNTSPQPSAAESALLAHLAPSLVLISTSSSYDTSQGAATGMVISSSGLVLTNNHVVAGATTISAQLASGGPSYSAQVLGYSVSSDVALIQLEGAPRLTPVRFASSLPIVGQSVTALGNAGGTNTLTPAAGVITALSRSVSVSGPVGTENLKGLYTSSAAVVPGDSSTRPMPAAGGRPRSMTTTAILAAIGGITLILTAAARIPAALAEFLRACISVTAAARELRTAVTKCAPRDGPAQPEP